MTSAPKSLRIIPQKGAGAKPAISITLIPLRAIPEIQAEKKLKCSEYAVGYELFTRAVFRHVYRFG
jgi:hypothetical protein